MAFLSDPRLSNPINDLQPQRDLLKEWEEELEELDRGLESLREEWKKLRS